MSDNGFEDLREALTILEKYADEDNKKWPTGASHDEFRVNVEPRKVSDEDKERLDELGFIPDDMWEGFVSFRFG